MLNIQFGRLHLCRLESKKRVILVLHGTQTGAEGAIEYDITVNGIRNTYKDLEVALGERILEIEAL